MSVRTKKRRAARGLKKKSPRFIDVRRRASAKNALEMVPARSPGFAFHILKEEEVKPKLKAGWMSISIPRFSGKLGQRFCRVTGLSQHFNLNLDDYGTFVWLALDGKKSVRELGVELKEKFGEKVEPLYPRLAHFLSLLERNKLIFYVTREKSAASS
jgi:hypothetical protein